MQAFIKTVYLKNLNNTELLGWPPLLPPSTPPHPLPTGRCSEPIPNLELSIFSCGKKRKKIKKIKVENAGVEEEISQIFTAGIYSGVETPERCLHPARDLFRGLTSSFLNEQPSTGNGTNVTRPSRVLQPCSLAALEVQGLVKDDFFLPEIAYIEKSPQPLSAV